MNLKKLIAAILSGVLCTAPLLNRSEVRADKRHIEFSYIDQSVNDGEPIRGVDISSIISLEKAGVVFRDENGKPQDIFRTLAENGVNYIRVRVWHNPYDIDGNPYGGGNCDKYVASEIGRRAAKYNMKLLVDLQYSDFWADPEKQTVPRDWDGFPLEWKKTSIYNYTSETLQYIADSGADIGMVQVGNETNCFFCGENDMDKICEMFSSGCKAVRDFDNNILIALHFANPSTGYYDWYAQKLNECRVDYDVFATSYYPYWHGTTDNLTNVLKTISDRYNKYVMVAETAYPYTSEDGDTFGNAVSGSSQNVNLRYPISVDGQVNCISDVFQAVANVGSKGIGVFYWEPAWIGVKGNSWEQNRELWNKYGSGWATDYAAQYDRSATEAGGSSYDNQALFDFDGKPLPSLSVFKNIYPQKEIHLPSEPSTEAPTEPAKAFIVGDINYDGSVDASDMVLLRKMWSEHDFDLPADLDNDGKLTDNDLRLLNAFLLDRKLR